MESAVPCHSNRTTRINFACFITALCSRRSKIGEPWFQPRVIWRSIRSLSSSRCRHHGPRHAAPHHPAGASVQSCLGPTCPIAKLAARHGAFCDLRQNHKEKRQHREPWRALLTARRFRTSGNTTQPRPVVGRSERPAPPSLADWAHHTHTPTTPQPHNPPLHPLVVPRETTPCSCLRVRYPQTSSSFDPIAGVDAFLPPGRADGKDVLGIG